jgi:hypothetical protein
MAPNLHLTVSSHVIFVFISNTLSLFLFTSKTTDTLVVTIAKSRSAVVCRPQLQQTITAKAMAVSVIAETHGLRLDEVA